VSRLCILNVSVWGYEENGYLFIRVFAPRINKTWIDVIKGGTIDMLPDTVIDVKEFIDEID